MVAAAAPAAAAAGGAPVNVLVVGGGGREHALCWRLRQSPSCGDLFCAPGNAGIAVEEGVRVVSLDESDHAAVVAFCADHEIGLVVCGPEAPLVDGLADSLIAADVPCFGPTKAAARLEGSKGFLKDLLRKYDIPTARYARFSDPAAAKAYIEEQGAPIVVKTDGLAAGKGVIVAMDTATALSAVDDMMVNAAFGAAGAEVVVEEFLDGEEASFFAVVGGGVAVPLVGAQDHKRVGEGDTGLNTGGMGAYSPAPVLTPALEKVVMETIVQPTVDGMAAEGCPFTGVIFAGLMIEDGEVKLLEHNVRFGDPECQCLMARMRGDLVDLLLRGDRRRRRRAGDGVVGRRRGGGGGGCRGLPGRLRQGRGHRRAGGGKREGGCQGDPRRDGAGRENRRRAQRGRTRAGRRRDGRVRQGGHRQGVRRSGRARVAGRFREEGYRMASHRAGREPTVSETYKARAFRLRL